MSSATNEINEIAIFDFDGTLSKRDTLLHFLIEVSIGSFAQIKKNIFPTTKSFILYLLNSSKDYDLKDRLKEAIFELFLTGKSLEEIEEISRHYAKRILTKKMHTPMVEKLNYHKSQGHSIMIISASPEIYIKYVAKLLEVDFVAGTKLEVNPQGILTGKILGRNCKRDEKRLRFEKQFPIRPNKIWAYGNSEGDKELLSMANFPTLVRNKPLFRRPR